MRYLVSQIEQWGAEIDAMPAPDPGRRKVGKKEAIVLLAKKLQAAQRRGHSTADLHEALSVMGLKVHVDTLRSALRTAGGAPVRRPASPRQSRRDVRRTCGESPEKLEPTTPGAPSGIGDGRRASRTMALARTSEGRRLGERPTIRSDDLPTLNASHRLGPPAESPAVVPTEARDFAGRSPVPSTGVDQARRPAVALSAEPSRDRDTARAREVQTTPIQPRPTSRDRAAFVPREDSDEL